MRKVRKKLWRVLMVVFIFLFIASMSITSVLYTYEAAVNDFLHVGAGRVESTGDGSEDTMYFKTSYTSLEQEFQAKAALIREIVAEGTVLLKNEGSALPVADGSKVAVYFPENVSGDGTTPGFADGVTIESGEGSFVYATNNPGAAYRDDNGNYTAQTSTSLTDALAFNGLQVTKVEGASSAASGCSTAFVVIGRTGGERQDLDLANEVLALTKAEKATIDLAKSSDAENVVLILSGDHVVEIGEYKDDSRIAAIVKVGNVGYRGAYGFADVITGKASPSGKLVDTYAAKVMSAPAAVNFGEFEYSNSSVITAPQANKYAVYLEGIYADYKYYETRYEDTVKGQGNAGSAAGAVNSSSGWNYDEEVVYPFGYGLSYTSFTQELVGEPEFDPAARTAKVTVNVTNNGSVDGKDVVAIYGQAPYTQYDIDNKVEKPAIQLLGFEKTGVIPAGGSETVEVTVHMQWLASFDYTAAKTYIMDAGDYYFSLGNGTHEALNNILAEQGYEVDGDSAKCYKWHQDELDTTTYATSVYSGAPITASFADSDINYWHDAGFTYLSRSDWEGTYPQAVKIDASQKMVDFLNNPDRYNSGAVDTKERASKLAVDGLAFNTESSDQVLANIITLKDKPYDDEGWNEILDSLTMKEMTDLINKGLKVINPIASITFPGAAGSDNPIGLNVPNVYSAINNETGETTPIGSEYLASDGISDKKVDLNKMTNTMYPSEPTVAATFNKELAYRQGEMMAEDGMYSNQEFIWSLGVNMHRLPYGGRTSEYYSADSVHATLIGAEVSLGAWSKGVVLVAKHFATNDQETNRAGHATFMNEQTLRENELRAFEGIMTYGECKGVMGTYNRLGLVSTCAEYDLMTVVLRDEWGAMCYVITDLCGPTVGLYEGDAMLVAGTDIMMVSGSSYSSGTEDVNRTLSAGKISNDKVLLNALRRSLHNTLYVYLHTSCMNGMSANTRVVVDTPWWQAACLAMQIGTGVICAASTILYLIEFNKKERKDG